MTRSVAIAVALCALFACHSPATHRSALPPKTAPAPRAVPDEPPPLGPLPRDVRPIRYRLDLTIAPDQQRFSGQVAIDVELQRPLRAIWLHGSGLTVSAATLTPAGKPPIMAGYRELDPSGVARLFLHEAAPAGAATLRLAFQASFDPTQAGLYRVIVQHQAYAFSQFEPIWARKAFPCFDEPAFKTPWTISLTVPDGLRAVANTSVVAKQRTGGMTRLSFAETAPLPSYLVAFAVGPLDVVDAQPIGPNAVRKDPLRFRGIAVNGSGPRLAYALERTPAILAALEEYTGIAYPFDKLDIIAVPDKLGAMENPGAVTFAERLLLMTESSPLGQRKDLAYVVAHELAHQWFGDLVTMPWWNDIWLNESFATWLGYRTVAQLVPDYEAPIAALSGAEDAMGLDSLVSARQIRQPAQNPDDIHAAFDSITYRKGGAVLAMFERYAGADKFRQGLHAYLTAHANGTATADDLLAALDQAAGKNIAAPFRTFLDQPGLPLVAVKPSCEKGKPSVELSQARYLPLGSKGDANKTWQVPVCLRYRYRDPHSRVVGRDPSRLLDADMCLLLDAPRKSVELGVPSCPEQILPNADSAGYYLWSLPPDWLHKLVGDDKAQQALSTREKMGVIRAIRAAYSAGAIDGKSALEAALGFAGDPHAEVAGGAMDYFRDAYDWLDPAADKPVLVSLHERARKAYRSAFDRLAAAKKSSADEERLRARLALFLATVGDDRDVQSHSLELAKRYLSGGATGAIDRAAIEPDQIDAVLQIAGATADQAFFDSATAQLTAGAADDELRRDLVRALGSIRAPALAEKARGLSFDPRLRGSEVMPLIAAQMSDPATRAAAWSFIESHRDALLSEMPPRYQGWFPMVAAEWCSPDKAGEARRLFEPVLPRMAGGRRALDNAVEAIALCAAKKQAQLPSLKKALQ